MNLTFKRYKWINLVAGMAFLLGPLAPTAALAVELHLGQEPPPVTLPATSAALALQKAFIDVAAAVSPGVVNISSEWTENIRGLDNFGGMDDFFNFWFYGPHGQRTPQASGAAATRSRARCR